MCKTNSPVIVGVSKGEQISIPCQVEADPDVVDFRWDLASSGQTMQVSPSKFTKEKGTSLLHYAPASNLDYGSLYCRGTNSVGTQSAPCSFQIVAAGMLYFHFTVCIRHLCSCKDKVSSGESLLSLNFTRQQQMATFLFYDSICWIEWP